MSDRHCMYRSAAENKKRQSCRVNKSGDGVNMSDDCLPSAKSTRCVLADKHRKSRVAVKKAKVALSAAVKAASPKASPKVAEVAEEAAVEAAAAATEVVEAAQNVAELSPRKTSKKPLKKKRRTEVERLQDGGSSGAASILKVASRLAPRLAPRVAPFNPVVDVFKTKISAIGAIAGLGAGLATKAHNAEINQGLAELKSKQSLVRNRLDEERDIVHKINYNNLGMFEKMFSNSPNEHTTISKPVLPPNHPKYAK
jgi:hypothetical protein